MKNSEVETFNKKRTGFSPNIRRNDPGSLRDSLYAHSKETKDSSQILSNPAIFSPPYKERVIGILGVRRCGKSSIHHLVFHRGTMNEFLFDGTTRLIKSVEDNSLPGSTTLSREVSRTNSAGTSILNFESPRPTYQVESFDLSHRETTIGLPQGAIINVAGFLNYEIWDVSSSFLESIEFHRGGKTSMEQDHIASVALDNLLSRAAAIIFVIDCQDDYSESLSKLCMILVRKVRFNSSVHLHVFIHKTDGLIPEARMEIQRDIEQKLLDELFEVEISDVFMPSFHLTSIYDFSIYEAFSKVAQKLLPKVDVLENSLNALCTKSALEKAFLFDAISKICIATDTSPVEITHYQLCSDMIDTILDISSVYSDLQTSGPSLKSSKFLDAPNMITAFSSSSSIRLASGTVVYFYELSYSIVLVCITKEFDEQKCAWADYNFCVFAHGITQVLHDLFDRDSYNS